MSEWDRTAPVTLLCGSTAYFDEGSGISYRCETCMAVVGSMGMPRSCQTLYDQADVINILKGGDRGNS
jgi:hypothetical protein